MSTEVLASRVQHSVIVRSEPERVYDAMTTAADLDGWFTKGSKVDARAGGHVRFRWENWGVDRYTGEDGGPVLEAVRPDRFVFQWHTEGSPDHVTTVSMNFEPHPEGTVVRLVEEGFTDTPIGRQRLLENATGWGEALTLLKFYVEHGVRY
jgi:uncharacterized protein YndB with AHSA1/START domain